MGLKTTRLAGGAAVVVASVLVAMAPTAVAAPGTHASTDQMRAFFIKLLVDRGVPYTSADDAVKLAQSTCAILDSGSPTRIQDAATAIQDSVNMRQEQLQQFAGAAVRVYCPDVTIS